jgi:hypothetical protein
MRQRVATNLDISKCAVISILSRVTATLHCYFLEGISISHQDISCVVLGVTVSRSLAFTDHINNIVSHACQRTSILFTGLSRNINILTRAFTVYVRPAVEYKSVVWNSCTVHLADLLESVQRSFTKRIPSISVPTYAKRLVIVILIHWI